MDLRLENQYEKNAVEALKKLDFVPKNFQLTANKQPKKADITITTGGTTTAGCDLIVTDSTPHVVTLRYNPNALKWEFADRQRSLTTELATESNLLRTIRSNWKSTPLKIEKPYLTEGMSSILASLPKRTLYETDLKNFPTISGELSGIEIEKYYQSKKCHYINVGTHGFYLIGSANPLKFKGVPRFSSVASVKWSARVQPEGNDNYHFAFEMVMRIRSKSPFNAAPCTKNNALIVTRDVKLPQA